MKKVNLSRKSKLFIGSIDSLAILAIIPVAIVSCSSTNINNNLVVPLIAATEYQTAQIGVVAQVFAQIQSFLYN